ncbi:MAG: T9SS type A sorting domain-containing protein [Saprospiraceae bacterium]|nr:T9SS type A sorting domain-containing protein [Saprospiraceae bacterium]
MIKTLNNPDLQHKIDVSLLPAGNYFVRFEKGAGIWTTKFVKI